jgi:hypothetical protein
VSSVVTGAQAGGSSIPEAVAMDTTTEEVEVVVPMAEAAEGQPRPGSSSSPRGHSRGTHRCTLEGEYGDGRAVAGDSRCITDPFGAYEGGDDDKPWLSRAVS